LLIQSWNYMFLIINHIYVLLSCYAWCFPTQPILGFSGHRLGVQQFNSDTNFPEFVSDHRLRAQSHKNVATSDTLFQVPGCHWYFWLISGTSGGYLNPLLRFHSWLEWLTELRRKILDCHQFNRKDTFQQQPNGDAKDEVRSERCMGLPWLPSVCHPPSTLMCSVDWPVGTELNLQLLSCLLPFPEVELGDQGGWMFQSLITPWSIWQPVPILKLQKGSQPPIPSAYRIHSYHSGDLEDFRSFVPRKQKLVITPIKKIQGF